MGQIVKAFHLCRQIIQRRLLRYEGAAGRLDCDHARSRQSVVGMTDGVEIYPESNRNLTHGGHSLTRLDRTGANCPQHLISYLDIDRYARLLYSKGL